MGGRVRPARSATLACARKVRARWAGRTYSFFCTEGTLLQAFPWDVSIVSSKARGAIATPPPPLRRRRTKFRLRSLARVLIVQGVSSAHSAEARRSNHEAEYGVGVVHSVVETICDTFHHGPASQYGAGVGVVRSVCIIITAEAVFPLPRFSILYITTKLSRRE